MDCSCAASNWFYPGSGSVNYNDDDDDHIHSFGFYSSDGKMEYEHTIFDWCAVRRVRILCYEPNICEESLNGKEKKTHNTITIDEEMCTLLTGVKKVCVFYWYCMLFCWFFFHHHHHLYRMCAFLCIIFSNAYIHWKKKKTIYVSESCYTYYIFFSLTFSSSFLSFRLLPAPFVCQTFTVAIRVSFSIIFIYLVHHLSQSSFLLLLFFVGTNSYVFFSLLLAYNSFHRYPVYVSFHKLFTRIRELFKVMCVFFITFFIVELATVTWGSWQSYLGM